MSAAGPPQGDRPLGGKRREATHRGVHIHRIDSLRGPLLVSWQITRDCDLCCLHCCTESAPGKPLPDELDADEAMRLAREIVRNEVPYVMLCGGEPLVVPHFFALAETLGGAGVNLKIETNGQRFDSRVAERLARLPIRSIQISLDGDTQETYERQRPGGSLARAHAACRAVRAAGLPLEVTFAPTRLNLHELPAVIERARSLGAFRFNTGKLMRIGTAARLWDKLEPTAEAYQAFHRVLEMSEDPIGQEMELCYIPFDMRDALRGGLEEPPATLLVLPNGWVKVAAALPYICADLRRKTLAEAWDAYCSAWRSTAVTEAIHRAIGDESLHAEANTWQSVSMARVRPMEAI
jgi:MoaA/NifB/PqqE/SkfB family radical SAM enzyme